MDHSLQVRCWAGAAGPRPRRRAKLPTVLIARLEGRASFGTHGAAFASQAGNGKRPLAWRSRAVLAHDGLAILLLLDAPLSAAEPQPQLTGETLIHDPSVMEIGGQFVAFGTGRQGPTHGAIRVKTSPDGIAWTDAGAIGQGPPAWAQAALGFQPLNVWAPSISRRGQTVFLYYCLSSFGHDTSAIGLMTNTAFDPLKPGEGWQDQGLVLMSREGDDFNAIDPFRIDVSDGRAYLAFGSFWSGIKLSELNPETGKLIQADAPRIALASRDVGAIEAASVLEHDGKFYLFVSFGQCCKGVASTYNIRVGRADRIAGPYRDKDGKAMLEGGGSLILATTGRFIGPGGQEAVKTSHGDRLAYHYYDGDAAGAAKLQVSPILWNADGWPDLGPLPQ